MRRGVPDISLGGANYAQVRIKVDDNLYLKGMAMYADDLPDGVDVRFNSNKVKGTPTEDVLKKLKDDPENPFGALIKAGGQTYYDDPNGKYINPETGKYLFDSFFDAFYWATCTLTTVGYGDLYPISQTGRVISIISSMVGIAIIALPSGIITAGYMDELKSRRGIKESLAEDIDNQ